MWIGISDRGMSKSYFGLSKPVAVNTDIYINECLQPKLLQLSILADIAGAHYFNEIVASMEENGFMTLSKRHPTLANLYFGT